MVRSVAGTPTAGDAYYAVFVTPSNGIVIQYRTASGVTTTQVIGQAAPTTYPVTLSITRASGTTFSAAINGTLVPGSTVSMTNLTGSLQAGLAVCSHNTSVLSTAVFDSVSP